MAAFHVLLSIFNVAPLFGGHFSLLEIVSIGLHSQVSLFVFSLFLERKGTIRFILMRLPHYCNRFNLGAMFQSGLINSGCISLGPLLSSQISGIGCFVRVAHYAFLCVLLLRFDDLRL